MKVVRVKATDWTQYSNPTDISDDFLLLEANIVGFLVKEDKEKIVLSHQWFERHGSCDDVRYTTVIPKKMILEREELSGNNTD